MSETRDETGGQRGESVVDDSLRPAGGETPREVFAALLAEFATHEDGCAFPIGDSADRPTGRAEWLARFDAAAAAGAAWRTGEPTERGSYVVRRGPHKWLSYWPSSNFGGDRLVGASFPTEWIGPLPDGDDDQRRWRFIDAQTGKDFDLPAFLAEAADDGWASMEKQQPPRGISVLVYDASCEHVMEGRWDGPPEWYFYSATFDSWGPLDDARVTHWRPLPEPPK